MSAVGVSVNDNGRKTQTSFTQHRVDISQHTDTGTARNDRGQLRGQKVRQSLQKEEEEAVVCIEHLTKWN